MIYNITYTLKNEQGTRNHVCLTLREAETFFNILICSGASYICVKTVKKRSS